MKLVYSANSVNPNAIATNKHEWLAAVSASDVSNSAARVALVLWQHAKLDGSDCFPSLARISALAKMSQSTVGRAKNELQAAGLLEWDNEFGKVCRYKLEAKTGGTPFTHDGGGSAPMTGVGSAPMTGVGSARVTGGVVHPCVTNTSLNTKKKEEGETERVSQDGGTISLCADLHAFWLNEFGDDESSLRLALIQVSPYVQPNSMRPLEAQVSSQLARIAREKRERDKRYQEAAARNGQTKKKRTLEDIFAALDGRVN